MRIFKKSLLIICAIVTLAGLLSSFVIMYRKRNKDGLILQNESGDRSYLNDIEFYGVLSDNIQQTAFRFVDNKWNKKFRLMTSEDLRERYKHVSSLYPYPTICSIDMMDVVPNPNPHHWEEDQQGNKSESYTGKGIITYSINNRQFSSDVIWSGNMTKGLSGIVSGDDPDFWDLSHLSGKGYIRQDDKLYLYTLTDSNCSGYGGVYDITEISKSGWVRVEKPSTTSTNSKVALGPGEIKTDLHNIAPLDLEEGKVKIVDMAATEKKLVYLFLRDEILYVRPFNLQTNSFENEIELGQIPKNAKAQNEYAYSAKKEKPRNGFTEMFFRGNTICVAAFSNSTLGLYAGNYIGGLRCAFYAANIENGILLQSYTEEPLDEALISIKNIEMLYKNDTLYVLRSYGVMQPVEPGTAYIPESRLKISVYKDSQSVYCGNILSGAQEDYKYQFQDQKTGARTYMREYYFIGLK